MSGLESLLSEAREFGFLGAQPIGRQVEHAAGFGDVYEAVFGLLPAPARLLDLGAGGGLPGLVLAARWTDLPLEIVLLDSSERRTEWLQVAVDELGLDRSVTVLAERAEEAGQDSDHRHRYRAVVARSFGRPAVTAECAAPFLEDGGVLIVSEPPAGDDPAGEDPAASQTVARSLGPSPELQGRWPSGELEQLGLAPAEEWRSRGFRYALLRAERPCDERFPRRNGVPAKRPLF